MKVLHINEHLARKGGVETYLLSLLPMLEGRGIEQAVLYGSGDPAEFERSVAVPGIGSASFRGQKGVREQVREVLRLEKPDVVHLHNVQNIGVLQACLDSVPTVMTAHDYRSVCPASTFFYKRTQEVCGRQCGPGCFTTTVTKHCLTPRPGYASYFYYRSKWYLKHAARFAHVFAPSRDTRGRLVAAGFPEDRISVLPYFCPMEPAVRPRPLPPRTTITFIGRIAPNKGHEYFVEALGLLPATVQGVMVGNFTDPVRAQILQLARERGCQDRLALHAWASREEVQQLLDRTTVFIFPSLWPETLGIVGLEALARGVPVVASDIGGVRQWLRHGENGLLVSAKASDQIRDAVLEVTSSDEKLLSLGANGIETIRNGFLPSQHVNELAKAYEHVVSRC